MPKPQELKLADTATIDPLSLADAPSDALVLADAPIQKIKEKTLLGKAGEAAGGFGTSIGRLAEGSALPLAGGAIGGLPGMAAGMAVNLLLPHQRTPEAVDVMRELGFLTPEQMTMGFGPDATIGPQPPGLISRLFENLGIAVSPKALTPKQRLGGLAGNARELGGKALDVAGVASTAAPEIKKEGLTPKTGGMLVGDVAAMILLGRMLRGGGESAPSRPPITPAPPGKRVDLKFHEMAADLEAERLSFELLPRISKTPEVLAERYGVRFQGIGEGAKKVNGKIVKSNSYEFIDPLTKDPKTGMEGNFTVLDLKNFESELTAHRVRFGVKPGEPVAPEPELFKMTRDEIDNLIEQTQAADKNIDEQILGKEGAKRWNTLHRQAESRNDAIAQKASDEISRIEASLPEESVNRLYGIGEGDNPMTAENLKDFRSNISALDFTGPQELGRSLVNFFAKIDRANMSNPTFSEQSATNVIKFAVREAERLGYDMGQVLESSVNTMKARYGEDAPMMIQSFFEKPARPVAPDRLRIEDIVDQQISEGMLRPPQDPLAPGGQTKIEGMVEADFYKPIVKKKRFSKEEMGFEKLPNPEKMATQSIADADVAPNTIQKDLKFGGEATPTKTFKSFSDALALEDEHGYFGATANWFQQIEKRLNRINYGQQLMNNLKQIAPDNGRILGEVENILHKHGQKRTVFGKPAFAKLSLEEAQNLHLHLQGQAEPLTSAVKNIAPAMREVYDYLFKTAKSVGFEDVHYIKDFQPRMLRQNVLETIYNYGGQMRAWAQQLLRERTQDPTAILQSDKQMAEIINSKTFEYFTPPEVVAQFIDNYKASGFGKTTGEALADLSRWAKDEYMMPFGSLDYSRKAKFPIEWYENDARAVFDKYIRRASKRIAEAKWVGINGEKGLLLQSQIAERDATLGRLADTALRRLLWIEESSKLSRTVKGFEEFNAWYQYGTKVVPSLLIYAQQPLQPFVSFMNQTGYIRGFKALGKSIFNKDMRELVRRSGVAQTDVFEATTGLASNQKMANAVRTAGAGFGWLNVFNKRWAVAAYNDFLHDIYNVANNPHSVRQPWAQKWMRELGIDPAKPLSPDDILRNAARLATDSQLQSNLLREPQFLSQPGVRTIFTLKRFTIKQFLWQKDMLMSEARKGNVLPILRAGLASVGVGEFYIWLRDKYKTALRGEKTYREEDTMWKRLINDVAQSSVLGWVGNLAGAGITQGAEGFTRQAGYLFTPALPIVPQNFFDLGETITKSTSSEDLMKDATRYILRTQLPLLNDYVGYRYLSDGEDVVLSRKVKFVKEIDRLTKLYFDKKNTEQAKRAVEIWNRNHQFQDRIIPPWKQEMNDQNKLFDDFTAHRANQVDSRLAQQMMIIRMMRGGLQNKK